MAPRSRPKAAGFRRVEFPYLRDALGRHAPIIYLQAYVDSGASWSVFHLDVAQLLGIKLSRAQRRYVALGNGSVIPIYLAKIKVRFAGTEFLAPAGFSDALRVGFNLLGRAGFFDRFNVTFDDRRRVLAFVRNVPEPR